jgi:hypothetical protein
MDYIDFSRLRGILEAFDNDVSGYITVAEINKFTSSRPSDWRCVTAIGSNISNLTNPLHQSS